MRRPIRSKNLTAGLIALWLVACGDDNELVGGADAGGAPEVGGDGTGGTGGDGGAAEGGATATMQFFVNERPHDPTSEEKAVTRARYSDPVRVVTTGLSPGSTVRFDVFSGEAMSFAVFEVPADGLVDFGRDAP
ncbi:MAG: hypothetical protein JNK04_16920, partial [Myxococcales bacterium]|nr:hypothetical protein [Myxococcales bacterium]